MLNLLKLDNLTVAGTAKMPEISNNNSSVSGPRFDDYFQNQINAKEKDYNEKQTLGATEKNDSLKDYEKDIQNLIRKKLESDKPSELNNDAKELNIKSVKRDKDTRIDISAKKIALKEKKADKSEAKDNKEEIQSVLNSINLLFGAVKDNFAGSNNREFSGLIKDIKDFTDKSGDVHKNLLKRILSDLKEVKNNIEDAATGKKELFVLNMKKALAMAENIKKQIKLDINSESGETRKQGMEMPTRDFLTVERNDAHATRERFDTQSRDSNGFTFQFSKKDITASKMQSETASASKARPFNEQMNAILNNAKVVMRDSKNGDFSVRLYPENLGRVNVSLKLEEGVLTGKMLVDNIDAKNLLTENLYSIKERLLEEGINVGEFQVNVRDERGAFERKNSDMPLYALPVNRSEVNAEYEFVSVAHHEGAIDLVI